MCEVIIIETTVFGNGCPHSGTILITLINFQQITETFPVFITVCNSSCRKVMFSQASVWPQGGVHPPWADSLAGRHPPGKLPGRQTSPRQADTPQQADIPPGRADTPLAGRHLPPPVGRHPPDGYCSGRYATYWNAFSFCIFLIWWNFTYQLRRVKLF